MTTAAACLRASISASISSAASSPAIRSRVSNRSAVVVVYFTQAELEFQSLALENGVDDAPVRDCTRSSTLHGMRLDNGKPMKHGLFAQLLISVFLLFLGGLRGQRKCSVQNYRSPRDYCCAHGRAKTLFRNERGAGIAICRWSRSSWKAVVWLDIHSNESTQT
jgi:hypothetical protein